MAVSSPFGSRTRTRLLLALELLGQSHARELARLLTHSLSAVQKGSLRASNATALIAGRLVGRTRLLEINPRYFAAEKLRGLIARLVVPDRDLKMRVAALKRRPRRAGKRL